MLASNLHVNIVVITIFSCYVLTLPLSDKKCGYESCPKPKNGYLNVHMVSHTHNDAGWLKTVDQYFYGSNNSIQWAGVQYIIDSIIEGLINHPHRKFSYVETVFFWKWWLKQNEHTRNKVRELVNEGRLEFVSGGWTMHDEATTHYQSIIDQMSWGFRRLDDAFGSCGRPRVGWQIDPFGHSRESASTMARFGFDGLLFGRLDYQDQGLRKFDKRLEMVWEASPNLGAPADLFTSVLYKLYSAPDWYCFDVVCGDPPIVDDKHSPDYNAYQRAADFVAYLNTVSKVYSTNNVLITMGGDFTYQAGDYYFLNLDKLMSAVNELQPNGSKMNLFYSTPSCYLKAVNDEKQTYTIKNDDFFPYASHAHAYWTGFFTSRPAIKYYERIDNNYLQVCKQLFTLSNLDKNDISKLNTMREAMGLLQHHDAITGTEKQHVAFDYSRQLSKGLSECESIANHALSKLMVKDNSSHSKGNLLQSCMLLNISACEVTESSNTFIVTLYNPLGREISHYVRLPVAENGGDFQVFDPSGIKIQTQVIPIPKEVKAIPGRVSIATEEVVFVAEKLPSLGFRSYYVSSVSENLYNNSVPNEQNLHYKSSNKIYNHETGKFKFGDITVDQKFLWYKSFVGDNQDPNGQSSGAYIFRPDGDPVNVKPPKSKTFTGPIVDEIHMVYNHWISQIVRMYHDSNYVEFNWLIGPIPIENEIGKEIITRYTVNDIISNKTFYTDSNGREMLERIRGQRPSFNISLLEPVAGNYYPVTTRIMIKDDEKQISVITDRAQGGTSVNDGQIELMLHRRILHDDSFGVNEPLNETAFGKGLVVRGSHFLTGGNPINQTAIERMIIQQKVLSTWSFFTSTTKTFNEWQTDYNMEYSSLKKALPANVQILTLEPWKDDGYLIRLEHIMENNDDTEMSKPVILNLKDIFKPFDIISIKEMTLGANELLKNLKRLVWKKNSESIPNNEETENIKLPSIKLKPMQIRSFLVHIENK